MELMMSRAGLLGGAGAAYGASRASQDPLDVIPAIGEHLDTSLVWSVILTGGRRRMVNVRDHGL